MRVHLPQLTASAALLAAACAAAAPDLTPRFKKHAAAVKNDAEAIDKIWRSARAGLADAQKDRKTIRAMRLRLIRAASGSDLHIQAQFDGYRMLGMGWAPTWNKALHRVCVLGPVEDGKRISCTVRVVFLADGSDPFNDKPVTVDYKVSGILGSSGLDAKYSTRGSKGAEGAIPACGGKVTGTLVRNLESESLPADNPLTGTLSGGDMHELYSAACWYQTHAAQVYQTYRAFCVAQANELSYTNALTSATVYIPEYVVFRQAKAKPPKKKPKGPPKKIIMDDDLGLDGLGGLGDLDEESQKKKPKKPAKAPVSPFAPDRLKTLEAMVAQLRRVRAAMEAFEKSGRKDPRYVRGGEKTDDPFFGPWFGSEPLPGKGGKLNILSADIPSDGRQNWPYLTGWRKAGPFPRDRWDINVPLLPECFETIDAGYVARLCPEWGVKKEGDPTVMWEEAKESAFGAASLGGTTPAMIYASTEIHSPSAQDVWMAIGVHDFAKVWLNDRLIAVSPSKRGPDIYEEVFMLKISLRAGHNRLVARCDCPGCKSMRPHIWARICTSGTPRPAATARAVMAKTKSLRNVPPNVVGFRRNGTGTFPDATPVTAWDLKTGDNILWRTPLDQFSKSAPVIAGDRVITMMDPHFVVCLDKNTGKILWTRAANVLEVMNKADFEKSEDLWKEYLAAKQAKDPQARKKRSAWRQHLISKGKCVKDSHWEGLTGNGPWVGRTFGTPITDGKLVWIKCATGATACYDLDGNRKWLVRTTYEVGGDQPLCPSPAMVGDPAGPGGRLVIRFATNAGEEDKKGMGPNRVIAYAPLTGEKVWETLVPNAVGTKGAAATTPLVIKLTDGKNIMDVVVTASGAVLRAEDGKILFGGSLGYSSAAPSVSGKVFYRYGWKYGVGTATELIMLDRDTVGSRRVWTARPRACGMGWSRHGDRLHAVSGSQFGGPYTILDALTGRQIDRHSNTGDYQIGWRGVKGTTDSYVPTIVAGDYVFLTTRGDRKRKDPWNWTTVVQAEQEGRFIAHNRMEGILQGHPWFEGERVYYRDEKSVICMGYKGETGRAYEAEQNAKWLFEDLDPVKPPEMEPLQPEPDPNIKSARVRFREDRNFHAVLTGSMESWLYAGPLPAAADSPDKLRLGSGTSVSAGGTTRKARGFDKSTRGKYVKADAPRRGTFDLLKLVEGKTGVTGYLYTTVGWQKEYTLRTVQWRPNVSIWIAGIKIKHRDRVRFVPGNYPVLVQFRVTDADGENGLRIAFTDSENYDAELKRWQEGLKLSKDIFDRIIKYKPDSELAKKAKICLAEM